MASIPAFLTPAMRTIRSLGLGKIVIATFAIVVFGALVTQEYIKRSKQANLYDDLTEWSNIPISEIEVKNGTLSISYSINNLSITIKNNNEAYTVQDIIFGVTIYDCPKLIRTAKNRVSSVRDWSLCETIGREYLKLSATIPPKQARGMLGSLVFPSVPRIAGEFAWTYEIVAVSSSKIVLVPVIDIN